MNTPELNGTGSEDKTFRVLEIIGHSPRASQRDLATSTGLSLGLVNLTLKRLIETGHIKVSSLNSKKFEYLLTPKGVMEKTRRTYLYLSRTIRTYAEYQKRLEQKIQELRPKADAFAILGHGEIGSLVEVAIRAAAPGVRYRFIKENDPIEPGEVALDCRWDGYDGTFGISVLSQLLHSENKNDKGKNNA